MQGGLHQKSTYEVWQEWAKALDRQMKRCAAVYEEKGKTANTEKVQKLIERIELFIDPVSHAQELAQQNYDVKGNVTKLYIIALTAQQKIFRDALKLLPDVSADMQDLLHSSCYECNGRAAMDIFKGPHRTTNEGISNGVPDERGGLPWVLAKLLEEAEFGGDEYLHKGLNKEGQAEGGGDAGHSTAMERHDSSYKPRKKETLTGIS